MTKLLYKELSDQVLGAAFTVHSAFEPGLLESLYQKAIMGGVHKRPKKHLRFSSLLDSLQQAFNNIPDDRNTEKIEYSLSDIYSYGFALFFLQDKSVLEFQRRLQKETNRNNLCTVFNIKNLPSVIQ